MHSTPCFWSRVDTQLALAKEQLDAAAQQLADGKAQLQQAIDTFGDVFASGVMDRVAGMGVAGQRGDPRQGADPDGRHRQPDRLCQRA